MSREIKLRAWNGVDQMIYSTGIRMGDILNRYDQVMEFTGLVDKNERDIYEGDIVLIFDDSPHVIEFIQGAFCWNNYPIGWSLEPVTSADPSDHHYITNTFCEVIGNVYQNPDLLKN